MTVMQPCAVYSFPSSPTGAGLLHTSTRSPDAPGGDWFASDECAAILAQRFEPETENPFAHDCEPEPEIEA